jgi:acetyl esterase/lipase
MSHFIPFHCRAPSAMTLAAALILNALPIVLAESPTNTAIVPVPKLENDSYDWYARHEAVLRVKDQVNPEIVMIGDSITHFWAGVPEDRIQRGLRAWRGLFGERRVLNLGFGWDRTQNVLWRLDHGEFDGLRPRYVVVNIGTNNFSATSHARANTPAEVAEGIRAICTRIRAKSPESRIILMGVFPRGAKADDPFRSKILELNKLLTEVGKDAGVTVLDIGRQFLLPNGELPRNLLGDFCHPTEEGYAIWAAALKPLLQDVGSSSGVGTAPAEPEKLSLWSGKAPVSKGHFESADATITVHRPASEKANRAAIVICPGGGYGGLVTGAEGHGIAKWLNQHGIAGIVLEYRLPRGRAFVPLLDAQRAIRMARCHAKDWNIDPSRIGIIGFSAGGHLASTVGTHFDSGDPQATDPIDRVSCRPDFVVLIYPVVTMGEKTHGGSKVNLLGRDPKPEMVELFSNEKQVTDQTPPMFLAHAKDDTAVVPENSRMLHEALKTHKVAAEYLELPTGGHGLNGYKGPMWDAWQKRLLEWLAAEKMIP